VRTFGIEGLHTIDGPLTRDFDDALSLEIHGDVYDLGIHIADVASLIPEKSALDYEAMGRWLIPVSDAPANPNASLFPFAGEAEFDQGLRSARHFPAFSRSR